MKILYFILCSLINLSLMFLVFLLEFLLIAKINIIASSVFQLILVFFMIIISIVISYFLSSIIVKNAISKFFNLDQ